MEVIVKDENAMRFPSIVARYDPKCTVKTVKHSESVILWVALVETRTGEHETETNSKAIPYIDYLSLATQVEACIKQLKQ